MNASLILAVLAALAIWVGSLYLAPFGRCPKCSGTGTIKRTREGKEDVPAFVELESGGPSPGACRVVGHG